MSTWIIQSETSFVSTEGDDWLDALAAALPHFHIPPGALGQLKCTNNPAGGIFVREPSSGLRLTIAPLDSLGADSPRPGGAAAGSEPWPDARLPPPPGGDAATLFERCAIISAAASIRQAAASALDLSREFVPAESGAVLLVQRGGEKLQFMAAFGPCAAKVLDSSIAVNAGLAGFVTNFPTGTIIHDVRKDGRFERTVDRASGYHTKSMLAVPVGGSSGPCFGCLELINGPERFAPQHLVVVQAVASALGAWLLSADT